MKVVLNQRRGGYSLSEAAFKELGMPWDGYGFAFDKDRANPELVRVVEKLGRAADGAYAQLVVVEIPDGIDWRVERDYDGCEAIYEGRVW